MKSNPQIQWPPAPGGLFQPRLKSEKTTAIGELTVQGMEWNENGC
ncbi:MAG TPA: hypothetical protein VGV18_01465 [Verrucomicrobiae bacterium]|nr:hypothetical protein [Verrucomicrobiae bacterium]